MKNIFVPYSVTKDKRQVFLQNYEIATHGTKRLFLYAGDQKVEHLNDDFYGEGIAREDASPEHLFQIAAKAKIGAFATQLGLLSLYGGDFKDVPYIVKLNSKTHLIKTSQRDPISTHWNNIRQVMDFKKHSGLNIIGIGYTVYYGSEFENDMLADAAKLIYEAHTEGLLTVVWAYPRGKAVIDEKDSHLIAGAAGATACLGADFVKVNYPKPPVGELGKKGMSSALSLKEAVLAAGKTRLICAGGSSMNARQFFQTLHDQINISGAAGNATGRNIHQRSLAEAIRFCNAIFALTIENASVEKAMRIYNGE